MKLFKKLRYLFAQKYFFIYTLREIPFKDTPTGRLQFDAGYKKLNWTEDEFNRTMNALDVCEPRCIGFFKSKKLAVRAVKENWGDWNEANYYRYAVIYEIKGEGLYNYTRKQTWYKAECKYVFNPVDRCWNISNWECEECENPAPGVTYLWS